MSSQHASDAKRIPLARGGQCLIHVLGQHFLVEVLESDDETVRVSFPGQDYPIAGMTVRIEFHDADGFDSYPVEVVQGRESDGIGIVLRQPVEGRRMLHRKSYRVPTDLTVQVKAQDHVRRYDAALRNIGLGGVFIETQALFDPGIEVEITISLPGEPSHVIHGNIVQIAPSEGLPLVEKHLYRVRFIGTPLPAIQSVSRYIWRRLREMYLAT